GLTNFIYCLILFTQHLPLIFNDILYLKIETTSIAHIIDNKNPLLLSGKNRHPVLSILIIVQDVSLYDIVLPEDNDNNDNFPYILFDLQFYNCHLPVR